MRRPKKRTVLILTALLLLVGITVIAWELNDWPPPRLILKYGFPPAGGPTGRTKVIEGIEFVEVSPGYRHLRVAIWKTRGDWLGRLSGLFGLNLGQAWVRSEYDLDSWIEIPNEIWVSSEFVVSPALSSADRREAASASSYPERLSRWLSGRERLGRFRPATRDEWHFMVRSGTLQANGCEFEEVDLKLSSKPDSVVFTGPEWHEREWTELQVSSRKVKVLWGDPDKSLREQIRERHRRLERWIESGSESPSSMEQDPPPAPRLRSRVVWVAE